MFAACEFEIMTLDGVVQFDAVADTIMALRDTEEALAHFFAKVRKEDAMLLGRITYQEWAEYWPTSTVQPCADHINSASKYVVSQTLDVALWGTDGHATALNGNLNDALTDLKQQPGKNIGIHGSPLLVESLLPLAYLMNCD